MPDKPKSIQIDVDEEMQKLLVETLIQDFKDAEEIRNKKEYGITDKGVAWTFDEKVKALNDMYFGNREPKSVPWKYCSNRSMKIAMAILEMLHARMFPAVWNEDLVRWRPVERTDKEKVERINLLMNWWIRAKTRMKNFFDKWTKIATGMGDVLVEGTWDVTYKFKGEYTETPITDEFGIQQFEKDGQPAISKEKKFDIEETTNIEIIPRENVYFQEGQTSVEDDPVIIKVRYLYSELEAMESEEKLTNVTTLLKTKLLEKIERVPFDGKEEDIEVIRDVKLRAMPVDCLKCYRRIDIDRDGFPEDVRILIDPDNRIYLGGVMVSDLSKRGKRPLDFTKVNDRIDRPDELEGYGMLEMVKPLADEIDAIFNQLTDANTLSILRPGFYDPTGELRPQNITLAPNKMVPVPDPRKNVYFPEFQIPTERLLIAIRTVMEFIERLTGASSYVMGKESEIVGGSGTATRTQAIVMAAEQRFSIPAQRLREGAGRILNIVLDLVQKNIPPGLETRVLGEDGEPVFTENELTAQGIAGELDCYIQSDASMGSASVERELATFLYQTLLQNPLVATDPMKIYKETANLLKAFKQDPEAHIGIAPDEKDTDKPEDENTLMFQGEFAKVHAVLQENHLQHMMVHQKLQQSPTMQFLAPEFAQNVLQYLQAHMQEHMMMLQQMMALMMAQGGQGGQAGTNTGAPQANQGGQNPQGVGGIPGPFGQVAETKKAGTSGASTPGNA